MFQSARPGGGRVSIVKISPPRITGVVSRERLIKLLDLGLAKPVVLVAAPGGSGKTTLVASFLDARKLPYLWYQCDEGDSDLASFFYYLGLAAKKNAPRRKKTFPLLTPEYLGGIPTFTRGFFEEFFGSVKKSDPFILVLDNYQEVSPEAPLHSVLAQVADSVPDNVHILVISRNDLPSELIRLRASEKVSILDSTALRFTYEETKSMVQGRIASNDDNLTQMLFEKSKGWAAGITLMLESARLAGTSFDISADCSKHAVFAYFAEEIFNKTEKKVRDFLLKTAILPVLTTPLAEKLTNAENAGSILTALSRQHYFTEKLSGSGHGYQYHPLFRDFLLNRSRTTFSPKKMQTIQNKAAHLLEQAGQIEHASSLFADSSDWKNLIRLILESASMLLAEGRGSILEGWLLRLPAEESANNPHLMHLMGLCRMPFSHEEASILLEKAFHKFEATGNKNGAVQACSAIMNSILIKAVDFTALEKWIDWLDRVEESGFRFPSAEVELEVAAKMLFVTFYQPWHPRTAYWRSRAEALIALKINKRLLVSAGLTMIIHYVFYGMMHKAATLLETMRPCVAADDVLPLSRIQWQQAETLYAIYGSPLREEYLKPIGKGIALSRQTGISLCDRFFFYYEIIGGLLTGNSAEVQRLLKEMDSPEYLAHDRNFHIIYLFMLVWKSQTIKEPSAAVEQIRHALAEIENPGPSLITIFNHIGMAHALLRLENQQEALQHLNIARTITQQMDSPLCAFMIRVTDAYSAIKNGQDLEGTELTRTAMALGSKHGIMTFPYSTHEVVRTLCKKALESDIESEYVKKLIIKHNLRPDVSAPQIETWPYPVKIRTLGRFEICIEGTPLEFSRKAPKKTLEMLKAIIAFGGTDVPVDKVIDVMWPDVDGDAAHSSFKVALHNLRRLLGFDEAILTGEGRISLNSQLCMVDAAVFQQQADAVLAGESESGTKDQLDYAVRAEKAISMYSGNFMASEKNMPAFVVTREKLRSRFICLVELAGRHYEDHKNWSKAITLYEKAIEADELQEDFYIILMQCYQKQARYNTALSIYDRYCSILKNIQGAQPSSRLKALHQKILSLT